MSWCPPCPMEFSRGNGTGVAEAVGNWGFSNEVASPGHELKRIECLLERMEELRTKSSCSSGKRKEKRQPTMCVFEHSPPECRPPWMFPKKSPMMCYSAVADTLRTSDRRIAARDALDPKPQRNYCVQGTDKWYKLGPLCCPQPCCPAPYCPGTVKFVCCEDPCH